MKERKDNKVAGFFEIFIHFKFSFDLEMVSKRLNDLNCSHFNNDAKVRPHVHGRRAPAVDVSNVS